MRAAVALLVILAASRTLAQTPTPTPADFFCPRPPTPTPTSGDCLVDSCAVGNCVADDTACIQSCLNQVDGTSRAVVFGPHCYKTTAQLTAHLGVFSVYGVPGTIIKPSAVVANTTGFNTFQFTPNGVAAAWAVPTTDVNSNRAFSTTSSVTVQSLCPSGSCLAAGDYVWLLSSLDLANQPGNSNTFQQYARIASIVGTTITFAPLPLQITGQNADPIRVPLRVSDPHYPKPIQRIGMMAPVTIHSLQFDGTNLVCAQAGVFCPLRGLLIGPVRDAQIFDLQFSNFIYASAFQGSFYGGQINNTSTTRSGSGGESSQQFDATGVVFAQMTSNFDAGFGPQFYGIEDSIDTLSVQAAGSGPSGECNYGPFCTGPLNAQSTCSVGQLCKGAGRGVKLHGLGWSAFVNVVSNSNAFNGVGITQGTYRTTLTSVTANGNFLSEGLWFSDQDNIYNVIAGGSFHGNIGTDITIYPTDKNNTITASAGSCWNNGVTCPGGDNGNVLNITP